MYMKLVRNELTLNDDDDVRYVIWDGRYIFSLDIKFSRFFTFYYKYISFNYYVTAITKLHITHVPRNKNSHFTI